MNSFYFKKALHRNKIVIMLFLLSLLSGIFWNHRFFFEKVPMGGDQGEYSCLATGMLINHEYTNCGKDSFRDPFYPVFIAGIFSIANFNVDAVRFVQLLLFGFISVFIYKIGLKHFGERVGILAGLFSSVWWVFANYTGWIYREILLSFLMIIFFYFLYKSAHELKIKYFVLGGFSLGLFTLTNSIAQYLIIFIIINFILIFYKKINIRKATLLILIFVVSYFLAISPWIIRNNIRYDKLDLKISSLPGLVLTVRAELMEAMYPQMHKYFLGHLIGYYFVEKIDPNLDIWAFRQFGNTTKIKKDLLASGKNLFEADEIMKKNAIERIKNQPRKYMLMTALDFINFNSPIVPQGIFEGNSYVHYTFAEGRFSGVPWYVKSIILITFRLYWYLFLLFLVTGILKTYKKWVVSGWMILLILYFNLAYSAVHALPRYAVQIYPFYILFATVGFFHFYDKIRLKYNKKYEK